MQKGSVGPGLTVVGLAAATAGLLRLAWLPGTRPSLLLTASPEQSLPLVLALGMAVFTSWLALTVVVALVAEAPGAAGRGARLALRRLAPAAVRRTLAMTLGLTVLTSTAGVAQAAGPVSQVSTAQSSTSSALSLDWPVAAAPSPIVDLDRPVPVVVHHDPARGLSLVTSAPRQPRVPATQAIPRQTVTVRPGDSLWRIAARALPRGAASAAIERSWHRWYAANRTVIGPDPSLIQPGQQLTPPA